VPAVAGQSSPACPGALGWPKSGVSMMSNLHIVSTGTRNSARVPRLIFLLGCQPVSNTNSGPAPSSLTSVNCLLAVNQCVPCEPREVDYKLGHRSTLLMPPQILFFLYAVLMSSLAIMVRWESIRRRNGPRLKPGDLDRQLGNPRISYSPPPERSKRSFASARR
jgi:hypothetical protein